MNDQIYNNQESHQTCKEAKEQKEENMQLEFAKEETSSSKDSKSRVEELFRQVDKRKTLSRKDERKIISDCILNDFDVDSIAKDFENFTGKHITDEIGGLVRRVLKRINKDFNVFETFKINRIKSSFLMKSLKFLFNKRYFEVDGQKIDLVQTLKDFMFKPVKSLKSIYKDEYALGLKIILIRMVEVSEMIDVKLYKSVISRDNFNSNDGLNKLENEHVFGDPEFFDFSNDTLTTMVDILKRFDIIQTIYTEVLNNKDNAYRRKDIIAHFTEFQNSTDFIREKLKSLSKETEYTLLKSVNTEATRRTDFCIQRFYEARFIDAIRNIDEIFDLTDKEDMAD